MEEVRLPAHIEVAGLIRQVQAKGGFATVIRKGEREAGTILVVLTEKGADARLYERMPQSDGSRIWHLSRKQDIENKREFYDYLDRRGNQDPDVWILELDIPNGERFIGLERLLP